MTQHPNTTFNLVLYFARSFSEGKMHDILDFGWLKNYLRGLGNDLEVCPHETFLNTDQFGSFMSNISFGI